MSGSILSFRRRARRGWLCVALFVAALPALAGAAPQSLRTEGDLNDVVDAFMADMVAGQVGSAYRGVARYWPRVGSELATLVAQTTVERRALRKTIGLSLGFESVEIERAAERVVRVTRLERFDDGALVWRFLFYRPNFAWQLIDVESSSDLRTLFGEPGREDAVTPISLDAEPVPGSSSGEPAAERVDEFDEFDDVDDVDDVEDSGKANEPPAYEAEYEIDIDGRP